MSAPFFKLYKGNYIDYYIIIYNIVIMNNYKYNRRNFWLWKSQSRFRFVRKKIYTEIDLISLLIKTWSEFSWSFYLIREHRKLHHLGSKLHMNLLLQSCNVCFNKKHNFLWLCVILCLWPSRDKSLLKVYSLIDPGKYLQLIYYSIIDAAHTL